VADASADLEPASFVGNSEEEVHAHHIGERDREEVVGGFWKHVYRRTNEKINKPKQQNPRKHQNHQQPPIHREEQ
jgi:hypothetical protein